MHIIEVKDVSKKYGKNTVVNNISFEVKEGETFGILGPNGAGKTTTLEMIETLRSISKGSIFVDSFDVKKNPNKVKKVIGVQLQSSSYFEKLRLSELLDLFASFYQSKINSLEILKQVGLEQKIKSYVNDLSGGQQQRFSIASTLVNEPKIIFLDEPTTGLDPQARRNIWSLIEKIRERGHTIVMTTHYMEEAEILCDRIAIMDKGKIIDINTPYNLIKKHGTGSIISFKSEKHIAKKTLLHLDSVTNVISTDRKYELYSKDDIKTIKDLVNIQKEFSITNLSIRPSTLEDVFLNLTGKKLRE